MKLFYLNLLLSVFVITWGGIAVVHAQNFKFVHDSMSASGPADTHEFVSYNHIVNLTDETLELTWERVLNELPDSWNTSVCDVNLCYESHVETADFVLAPHDTGNIDVHFRPEGETGNGNVQVQIYETEWGASGGSVTAFFSGEATTPTRSAPVVRRTEINFYPNPVDEYLNITFSRTGTYKVEIYNVLGKNVVDETVKNTNFTRIYFDEFPNGVYLLTVKNETTGERVTTKRFTKE